MKWNKEFVIPIVFMVIVMIALVFFIGLSINKKNKFNPETDVLEGYKLRCFSYFDDDNFCHFEPKDGSFGHIGLSNSVSTNDGKEYVLISGKGTVKSIIRKKTPQELETDYCNNNPDDNERCNCQEYEQETWWDFKPYFANSREEMDLFLKEKGSNISLQGWSYLFVSNDGENFIETDFSDIFLDDDQIKGFKIKRIYFDVEEKVIRQGDCIKAIPKTECEKGNKDYIFTCPNNCERGYVTMKESDVCKCNILRSDDSTQQFIIKDFICRPKTEVEKLMDMDCIDLFKLIIGCDGLYEAKGFLIVPDNFCEKESYENLKQAYRNKECSI